MADAAVYNTRIRNVITKVWKGEHNLAPPPEWKLHQNPGASKDHYWNRQNPNHRKNLKSSLRPGHGDTDHNKDGDGDGSECGAKESYGHGSGWGDEGGTGDSRSWSSGAWRSSSRTWTAEASSKSSSIDHNQWQGSPETVGDHHWQRKAQPCSRPRSRSRVYS